MHPHALYFYLRGLRVDLSMHVKYPHGLAEGSRFPGAVIRGCSESRDAELGSQLWSSVKKKKSMFFTMEKVSPAPQRKFLILHLFASARIKDF